VLARITVSYSQDIDRVVEILRQTSERMMEDETLAPLILNPFEFMGVDSLDEFSVVLLVRIHTAPGKQLTVGRAFNRLVKIAFDEHGIATRDPAQIEMVGAPALLADTSRDIDPSPQRRRA
jgi:moderate conductance mechanosensitive channel